MNKLKIHHPLDKAFLELNRAFRDARASLKSTSPTFSKLHGTLAKRCADPLQHAEQLRKALDEDVKQISRDHEVMMKNFERIDAGFNGIRAALLDYVAARFTAGSC